MKSSNEFLDSYQFCTFLINDRMFGVDLLDVREVREVNQGPSLTTIYHAPEQVRGYINIRGQIHLVLDLRVIIGFDPIKIRQDHCVIIFKKHVGEFFGILVDKIIGVEAVIKEQIEEYNHIVGKSILTGSDIKTESLQGICKLEKNLMIMLDSKTFLSNIA